MLHSNLKDKIWYMYKASLYIEEMVNQYKIPLTDTELNTVYGHLDGLTEDFFMRHIEGRCSLQAMLDWSLERLETLAITRCKEIRAIRLKVKYLHKNYTYLNGNTLKNLYSKT